MSGESEPESLPEDVYKTILEIKKAFGKYSDEDIYTLLKDCNMDLEQVTQKLQYFETFEEVKRKEKKVSVSVNKGRKGSRFDNRYTNYDGEQQNQYHARQENPRFRQKSKDEKNVSRARAKESKDEKTLSRAKGKESKEAAAHEKKDESARVGKESKEEAAPPTVASSVATPPNGEESKKPPPAKSNLDKKRPDTQIDVSSSSGSKNSGPGPTPASTPTNPTPSVAPRQQQQQPGKSSLGKKGPLPSPSDPVAEPRNRNHGAIQRETSRNQKVFAFSGRQQAVVFPNRVLAPEDIKTNILFGTLDSSTFLENTEAAAPKNESQPESPPPPQEQKQNADLIFNQPKQEVLPPFLRSQQDSVLPPQQVATTTPPRAQSSARATFAPFVQNSYPSQMYPYYSQIYMPQVPHPVLSHSGYSNQMITGVAGAKYPFARPREENKEENVFYNLAQAYPPPPAAASAQGGPVFPSVLHQGQSVLASQQQQQMGGEAAPLSSYPRSQYQYGGQYWNREN